MNEVKQILNAENPVSEVYTPDAPQFWARVNGAFEGRVVLKRSTDAGATWGEWFGFEEPEELKVEPEAGTVYRFELEDFKGVMVDVRIGV